MFAYPRQAEFNRVLPKNKIYAYARASRAVQDKFVAQVDRIVWRYKLAPETINLPERHGVREIQIFDLHLKQSELSDSVLRTIDLTVRHPIFFRIYSGGRIRFAAAYKRPNESDATRWVVGSYFFTDWQDANQSSASLPVALNMHSLYEQMLRAHVSIPARDGESLRAQMARIALIHEKERDAAKLEGKISKEKQFNRKVELNRELRTLREIIQQLMP